MMIKGDDIHPPPGGDTEGGHRPLPAERVFCLVATLLESPRPMTRDEILDRLAELYVPHGFPQPGPETLRKMFERDKRLVKDMGVPLVTVEPGEPGSEEIEDGAVGYRIDESDLHVPEITLDEGQRVLLLAMAQTLLGSPDFPLREDLAMAVHKVLLATGTGGPVVGNGYPCHLVLGDQRRDARRGLRTQVEVALGAVHERRSLSLRYRAAGRDRITERVVDPHGLTLMEGSWLLTGYCHLRHEVRTFALHRVVSMTPVDPEGAGGEFEPPEGFSAGDVARVRPWHYAVHEPTAVALDVDADFAWHARALLGCEPDLEHETGSRWSLVATNADALVELALMYGPRIRLVSPGALAERVVEEIRCMGEGTGTSTGSPPRDHEPFDGTSTLSVRSARDDAMTRLRRFTFLVSYLSANPEAELPELCRILGVSEHVLATDLERLSLCGVYPSTDFRLFDVAVDSARGRVWFRKNPVPSLSRPVKLTRREVVALLLGFKILRDGIAPPFDWAADQVIREVLRAAGRDARAAVQELESRVSMGSRHDLSWDTFYELSRAVCERRRVRITYYTRSRDTIGERTVRPYVLACSLGRWYLVGHCEWRDEVRTFRLDRIRTAALMDDGFVPPTTFNPSAHLGSGIYPTHGPGGQHRVVIDLEPFFAAQQGFVVDAPAGDGDGLCSVAFDVPEERFEGFLSWLVSMTTRFRIVSPPSLASRFDERRRRILAAYESVLD